MTPHVHLNPVVIPETTPRSTRPDPPRAQTSLVAHYILAFSDLALFRFLPGVQIGPCDWLRIESTYPIAVLADRQPVTRDEDVAAISTQQPVVNPSWDAGASGALNTRVRPAYSFTIQRPVTYLQITATGDVADYATAEVPGAIHLWVGNADITDVSLGRPIFHVVQTGTAPGAATATIAPIRPTLHGDNGAAPTSTLVWVPSVTEILRVGISVVWTGAAGVINAVRLNQIGQGANRFAIADWRPGVAAPWEAELSVPIWYENYQSRRFFGVVDDRGALEVTVGASAAMDFTNLFLSCRSYM
jgi:hypothetical protein